MHYFTTIFVSLFLIVNERHFDERDNERFSSSEFAGPTTNRAERTFRGVEGGKRCAREGRWMDFQDWRDDICLVYGKTYARVRTAEVRSSINRPLLKSHVNGSRVYLHTPTRQDAGHARTRVHTYITHARSIECAR